MADPMDVVAEVARDVGAILQQTLEDALVQEYLTAIMGPVSQEAVDRARDLASHAASSLIESLTEAQLRATGDVIARALEDGLRPLDVANRLTDVVGLDSNRAREYERIRAYLEESGLSDKALEDRLEREYQRLLRDRQKVIAQTEGREATSSAREIEAAARGGKWKYWILTADEHLCDVCAGNEAAGVIPFDAQFPSGVTRTPAHPRCRCTIGYVTSDAGKVLAENRNARNREITDGVRAEAGKEPLSG